MAENGDPAFGILSTEGFDFIHHSELNLQKSFTASGYPASAILIPLPPLGDGFEIGELSIRPHAEVDFLQALGHLDGQFEQFRQGFSGFTGAFEGTAENVIDPETCQRCREAGSFRATGGI